jgi:hypothetical protein
MLALRFVEEFANTIKAQENHRIPQFTCLSAVHRSSSPGFYLQYSMPVHQVGSRFPDSVCPGAHASRRNLLALHLIYHQSRDHYYNRHDYGVQQQFVQNGVIYF